MRAKEETLQFAKLDRSSHGLIGRWLIRGLSRSRSRNPRRKGRKYHNRTHSGSHAGTTSLPEHKIVRTRLTIPAASQASAFIGKSNGSSPQATASSLLPPTNRSALRSATWQRSRRSTPVMVAYPCVSITTARSNSTRTSFVISTTGTLLPVTGFHRRTRIGSRRYHRPRGLGQVPLRLRLHLTR